MSQPRKLSFEISESSPDSISELLKRMAQLGYTEEVMAKVEKAYHFSEEAHQGQFRRSGEPYISHPLGVASILVDLGLDYATVVTGLLHDTVEDTAVTLQDIELNFGEVVAGLVDGVTKISKIKFRQTHEKQGENIRKMIVAMGKDVRVVLVKLADRLHNMRTLNHMPYEKQKRIADETLAIYSPLASRLGINSLKVELEDLSFRYSNPDGYYDLAQKVAHKRKEREKYIDDVKRELTQEIQNRSRVQFEISGRPKHLYSIYKKMMSRNIDYDQVYDVLAFRVNVGSVPECYEVLGIVHSMWKPIPGRFKDFIAMPKTNNYQSLHTTVIGPGAERIEIQIRTHDMHSVAEWGIAAHWRYKENQARGQSGAEVDKERFNWLRELVSLHQQTRSADEFLENVKTDLAESEIYVFTPKGEVKEFPEGATPIDFAYAVHTDLGEKIVAGRVNGKLVSLKHKLQNGDTVEVITSKNQNPSKDWLKFCVTTKAKSKIRTFVKTEQRARSMELGQQIVDRVLKKKGLSAQKHLQGPKFDKLLKDSGCSNLSDLYIRVGYGKVAPEHILDAIGVDPAAEAEPTSYLQRAFRAAVERKKKTSSLIRIDGLDDVLVRFGKCCHPIPGDSILGFITRGRGITVHRSDCEKAFELDQARRVEVEWSSDKPVEQTRLVRVRVVSHDTAGLLKLMTEVFSARGMSIQSAQVRTTRDKKAISTFDVSVRDTQQLSEVMGALGKIKGILTVTRITHS